MEDRPRFQTGPREIRPSGIIGGPRETWPGWNRAPTSHTERARMVTLHLYTGAPELYPNNPTQFAANLLYSQRDFLFIGTTPSETCFDVVFHSGGQLVMML